MLPIGRQNANGVADRDTSIRYGGEFRASSCGPRGSFAFSRGKRGPIIPVPRGKTRITIRLDKDLIDWFRSQVEAAGGGNYQTLINSALRNYLREVSSEIAEDREGYGKEFAIDEFGPMTAKARSRWARQRESRLVSPGRSSDADRSRAQASLAFRGGRPKPGVSLGELIERGLKAVLAAQGRL